MYARSEPIAMFHPTRLAGRGIQARRRKRRPQLEILENRQLLSTLIVTNTNDSGDGSLRNAITLANVVTSGIDTIDFAIPGTGVHTIAPLSDLPAITAPFTIDGYSQSGASPNTLAVGDNAKITIELSGNAPGTTAHDAFAITAGGTTVRGLAIDQFGGDAFAVSGGAGDSIAGDFVGTDPTGTNGEGNGTSEFESILVNASGVTIGGPAAADRTIVSNSGFYGIRLQSGTGDVIENSYIGTDASGTVALPTHSIAIYDPGASNITIGGTTAALRNVISGNHSNAIALVSTAGNVVEGNYIGIDSTGTRALANGSDGIVISVGGNTIGGNQAGAGNVISGNIGAGVLINYSSPASPGNVVQGNLIGTDKTGTQPIPNDGAGVNIGNAGGGGYNNTIGGTTPAERNIVSGNVHDGIDSSGTGSTNVIVGNYVGVDITGLVGLAERGRRGRRLRIERHHDRRHGRGRRQRHLGQQA